MTTTEWFRARGRHQFCRVPLMAAAVSGALLAVLELSSGCIAEYDAAGELEQVPVEVAQNCSTTYFERTTGAHLSTLYTSNYPLDPPGGKNPNIKRVVVVNHGLSRNCGDYFTWASNSVAAIGKQSEIFIFSVRWLQPGDVSGNGSLVFYSGGENWRGGDQSLDNGSGATISNFAMLDDMTRRFLDGRFPNLNTIVYSGHSAGGQVMDRYPAGSTLHNRLARGEVTFLFVPMNPSSWLYLDGKRWDGRGFSIPSNTCGGTYNRYKYGLENLNRYMAAPGVPTLLSNFHDDFVVYGIGSNDTTNTGGLDTSCPANLQGPGRRQRAETYLRHVQYVYGPSILRQHELVLAADIAHSGNGMYNSPEMRRVIFGCNANGTCEPPNLVAGETQSSCPEDCGGAAAGRARVQR